MDGAAPPSEHIVTCFAPRADGRGDEQLRFDIDGKAKAVELRIGHLRKSVVVALPDIAIDLIELAAFVYAIDSSISRGGLTDRQMGAKWHRRFRVTLPVRKLETWSNPALKRELEETLMFLSGDRFSFTFTQMEEAEFEPERYFDFDEEDAWQPDTVLMFSGGLDSFAGALEEIIERRNKVALISHFSATKIAPIQRDLYRHMVQRLGPNALRHFPMRVQLRRGTNAEGTHRARSFLFAALGMATSVAFGRDRVAFYENGIVSLNLPPVGNVVGTRATRTTHPQTLQRFECLFSQIFSTPLKVDNPFFWRTKTEVVETIARLGMADQIPFTRSCADVHNQTKQHPHCGRCSQCIDRRFAILASRLQAHDPEEAYRIDLMSGPRGRVQDKEIALSYVRCAVEYEVMTLEELATHYPAVFDAIGHLGEPEETALKRVSALLRRHGKAVAGVVRAELSGHRVEPYPDNSLAGLFGSMQRSQLQGAVTSSIKTNPESEKPATFELVFDRRHKVLTIDGIISITGATYDLLNCLANAHLRGSGDGREPLDYPIVEAGKLASQLGLVGDGAVRQRVGRSRGLLGKNFTSAGLEQQDGRDLIENLPWHGYRLNPTRVRVRIASES